MYSLKEKEMKTAYELIKKNNLLLPKEKIGVACSGGIDSMCLLHFLNTNKDLFGIQVFAINIDHSIREKSADDSKFVENFCKYWFDSCHIRSSFVIVKTSKNIFC